MSPKTSTGVSLICKLEKVFPSSIEYIILRVGFPLGTITMTLPWFKISYKYLPYAIIFQLKPPSQLMKTP